MLITTICSWCARDSKDFLMEYYWTPQVSMGQECKVCRIFLNALDESSCWIDWQISSNMGNVRGWTHCCSCQIQSIFINQCFIFYLFNVSNEGDVNPPHANKVVVFTKWGPIIAFVDAYVGIKQWAVVKIQDAYRLQFTTCCKLFIGKRRSPISIIKLLLHYQMSIKELLSINATLCSHNLVLSSFDGQNTRGML